MNKNNPIHYKGSALKFDRPQSETRTVSGYFAAFDTIDNDMDVIRKGAFAKSLEERGVRSTSNRKIKYLHQHNPLEMAGAFVDLKEDDYGLYFEAIIERTPLGDVILERYSNGTYTEHSIGFKYVADKCNFIEMPIESSSTTAPRGDSNIAVSQVGIQVFECKELNLFEGSVVTWGANMNTPFVGFKGTKEDAIKELKTELDFLLKHAPNYDYELQLRRLYHKQISLLESTAVVNTKEASKPIEKGIDYNYIITNFKL